MEFSNSFDPLSKKELIIQDMFQKAPPRKNSQPPKPRKLGERADSFVSSLPDIIHRQVSRLLDVQVEKRRLEEAYHEELLELQNRYLAKYQPLYLEREIVVTGADLEDDLESMMESFDGPAAGIPEFWLTVMQNHEAVSYLIQDWDQEALTYITNIRVELLKAPEMGFRLVFDFAENRFFTNKRLTKTYTYEKDEDGVGLFYDESVGDFVHWRPGNELPPQHEFSEEPDSESPPKSFFNFFNPPSLLDSDEELDVIAMTLSLDYGYGEAFKEKLIPDAVDWFTGEAAG